MIHGSFPCLADSWLHKSMLLLSISSFHFVCVYLSVIVVRNFGSDQTFLCAIFFRSCGHKSELNKSKIFAKYEEYLVLILLLLLLLQLWFG